MTTENSSSPNTDNEAKEALEILLKQGRASVTFLKSDGTERVMQCTLLPDVIIPYEAKTDRVKIPKPDILPVWDLEANAWRSITVSKVISIAFDLGA